MVQLEMVVVFVQLTSNSLSHVQHILVSSHSLESEISCEKSQVKTDPGQINPPILVEQETARLPFSCSFDVDYRKFHVLLNLL